MKVFSFKENKVIGIDRVRSKLVHAASATYVKSTGSFIKDFMLTRREHVEELNRGNVITNSVGFLLAAILFNPTVNVDTGITEKQIHSILPTIDGMPTRVRGKTKKEKKLKKAVKVTSVNGVIFIDVDNMNEQNLVNFVAWASRVKQVLSRSIIAWRKKSAVLSVNPITRKIIEIKIKEEKELSYFPY